MVNPMRFQILLVTTALLVAPVSLADTPDLVTDRPDQTESTEIVPKGSVQSELGLGDSDGADATAAGLARIGLADRVELRVGLDELFLSGPEDAIDVSLGTKIRLARERGLRVTGFRRPPAVVPFRF
jgi:hypothetical protein